MADRRDDRLCASRHRAHDAFLVEGPQILHRAAAACHDDHTHAVDSFQQADRLHHLVRRADALHPHRAQQNPRLRVPPQRHVHDVVNHRAGWRGNHADRVGIRRQRPLALRLKQALPRELFLQRQQPLIEHAHAFRAQAACVELHLSALDVQTHAAGDHRAHALKRRRLKPCCVGGVHHAVDCGVLVLERKEDRARLMEFQVADLALQLHAVQHRVELQHAPDVLAQLRDGQRELTGHALPPRPACSPAASQSSSVLRRRARG